MKHAVILAITSLCTSVHIQAAALERSGQSVLPFLESQNYAEINLGSVEGNISGENANKEELAAVLNVSDFSTGNLVEDIFLIQGAVKVQAAPKVSVGLLFDQPFGIKLDYSYSPESILGHEQLEAININIKSKNMSALVGYQPTERWSIYGGVAYQNFKGNIHLFGQNFYFFNGYRAELKEDAAVGWLTGISYQIPEIALRANLTYRSKIKHKNQAFETTDLIGNFAEKTQITTPQSVNLDLMTAVSPSNLVYGSVRWVDWSNFKIKPNGFGHILQSVIAGMSALPNQQEYTAYIQSLENFNLIDYKKDQWSAKLGIAHRISEQWIASAETVWDNGSDNPASTINPADGYTGLGSGLRYQLSTQTFISGGIYYLRFRPSKQDKDSISVSSISTLNDKEAWAYGLRIGHYF